MQANDNASSIHGQFITAIARSSATGKCYRPSATPAKLSIALLREL